MTLIHINHTPHIHPNTTATMSSDKSIVMKAFLHQFSDFLEDVQNVFPENADIDSAKTALMLMKKTNLAF